MLKVSVVVATYNGEQFIKEQLDSILNKTYPIYEVIVKDDGSTDNTVAIVKEYTETYPIVHLVKNDINMGITSNILSGFYMAQGDYIAYSDQDDIWISNKIEKLLSAIGEKNLIYSNSAICDQDGKYVAPLITKEILVSEIVSILDLIVWGHQLLFKRDILYSNDVCGLSKHIWFDSLLPILAFRGDNKNVVYLDEMLVSWRRHPKASSFSPRLHKLRIFDDYIGVLKAIFSWFDINKRKNVQIFYKRMKDIRGLSEDTYRVIDLMSSCTFFDVIKAGIICLRNYVDSFPQIPLRLKIRLFLKPFFVIRNQSKGICLDSMLKL